MKRLFMAALIGLALSTAAFADHAQDSFGLGGIFGVGVGWNGWVSHHDIYPASLSLKIPKVPIFWGLNVKIPNYSDFAMGVTGDYYILEPNLVRKTKTDEDGSYNIMIDWYFGVGFYTNAYMGRKYRGAEGGLRIPFGVSWHALQDVKKLEVSVGSVGGLGIGGNNVLDDPYFHFYFIPVEIAVRWWFG